MSSIHKAYIYQSVCLIDVLCCVSSMYVLYVCVCVMVCTLCSYWKPLCRPLTSSETAHDLPMRCLHLIPTWSSLRCLEQVVGEVLVSSFLFALFLFMVYIIGHMHMCTCRLWGRVPCVCQLSDFFLLLLLFLLGLWDFHSSHHSSVFLSPFCFPMCPPIYLLNSLSNCILFQFFSSFSSHACNLHQILFLPSNRQFQFQCHHDDHRERSTS